MSGVFMTAAGVICHTGRGLDALHRALMAPATQPDYKVIEELQPPLRVPWLRAACDAEDNRIMALADTAMRDALAGFSAAQRQDMALFLASSSGDLNSSENGYAAAVAAGGPALSWREPGAGLLASRLARQFGIGGGQFTINTACSSGVHALLYAAAAIRRSDCSRAVVIGLECPGRVTLAGFNSLLLITPTQCRPFDRDRDGLLLGEAAAAVVLESQPAGPAFAGMQLLGGATACDARSLSQTDPSTVADLVAAAMRNAGIDSVDAIKAHGTGTLGNDSAEAAGIRRSIDTTRVPITSIKPVLGHTLGACGVLETLAMATCWQAGQLPPTDGFATPDEQLGLLPAAAPQALAPGRMLLDYFGFGGNNGVLALGYAP